MAGKYLVAEMPLGQRGLYGNRNQANLPVDALTVANNISLAEGGFVKEGGSKRFNSTAATGAIIGGTEWHPTATRHMEVIAVGGHIMHSTGTTTGVFADIATGLNAATKVSYITGGAESIGSNKKLFIFNGVNLPQYIDGTASAIGAVSIPASDWSNTATGAPTFGVPHQSRIWVGGNQNDPHRIYYSTASNHLELSATGAGDAGTLSIYPGQGDQLVGGHSFKGFLVLFKSPRGVYYVDNRNPTVTNWRIDQITDQVGAAGIFAHTIVENDIMFLDIAGNFHMLSIVTEESKLTSNISKMAEMSQWFRDNVNMSQLHNARMVYYPRKREVHCAVAGSGKTVNNLRVIIDFNAQQPRFRVSDKDENSSMWLRTNADDLDELAIGNESGYVFTLDNSIKQVGESSYESRFKTPFTDLSYVDPSLSTIEKNFGWLELQLQPTENATLSMDIFIDGENTQTVDFSLGSGGVPLDTFLIDTDVLGGADVLNKKKRITGKGRRIAFQGRQAGLGEDFNISKMLLHFKPGSSRI